MTPDLLFWIWIAILIPFGCMGIGTICYLPIRYFHKDNKDAEIEFQKTKIKELTADNTRLVEENGKLVLMLVTSKPRE